MQIFEILKYLPIIHSEFVKFQYINQNPENWRVQLHPLQPLLRRPWNGLSGKKIVVANQIKIDNLSAIVP